MKPWILAGRFAAALALAALGACGGGGGTSGSPPPVDGGTLVGPEKDAPLQPADATSLTAHFRDRLAATATAASSTASGGPRWAFTAQAITTLASAPAAGVPASTAAGAMLAAGASSSVLQEAGVDEGDVLVTDGARVYALAPRDSAGTTSVRVRTVNADGTALSPEPDAALPAGFDWTALYLPASTKRLVATGQSAQPIAWAGGAATTLAPVRSPLRSGIRVFDLADPARPAGGTSLVLDGRIQSSRMVGSTLWLVVASEPRFDGFDWSWARANVSANRAYIASLTAAAVLPTISRDGGAAQPLVSEGDCFVQPDAPGGLPSIVTVVSIDLSQPSLPRRARCFAGSTDTVYMTAGSVYLASVRYPYTLSGDLRVFAGSGVVTDLHKFALSDASIDYRGSGRVPGRLSWGSDTARFMLSEAGSDLRVVTMNETWATAMPVALAQPSTTPATSPAPSDPAALSPARLTVLRDTGRGLTTLATLPNATRPAAIGKPGEQVHAVRYIGARAYVVTFRRTDPLYVIDVADPADPKLAGQLEVPGFSDRLYPLTDTLLLGVGHDAVNGVTTGVRVSLLDVSSPDRPVERAARTIGGRGSTSAADLAPQGTMIRRVGDRIRVALPVDRYGDAGAGGAPTWLNFLALEAWRFVIDPATGTWTEPRPVQAQQPLSVLDGWGNSYRDLVTGWLTRSLDLGDTSWLYYDGRFVAAPW